MINPRGGTEILIDGFNRWVDRKYLSGVNFIISVADYTLIRSGFKNVLWHHLDVNQQNSQGLGDPRLVESLDRIIFVSRWQMDKHIEVFGLPKDKCSVVLNAIQPIPWVDKTVDGGFNLVYTSTPWRGLEVLLESFKLLKTAAATLNVYSSTIIYGKNYMKNSYDWLFDRCRSTPGVKYHGYATNLAVIKACQRAHMLAYPSIFAETSCLSAIEAGAAGCTLALTDHGALTETCGSWGHYAMPGHDLVEQYATLLDRLLTDYQPGSELHRQQAEWFNSRYSWITRAREWKELLENL